MKSTVVQLRNKEQTVETFVDSFYNEYKLNSEATASAYKDDVIKFIIGNMPLGLATPSRTVGSLISYQTVTSHRAAEVERDLKPASINRKITAIKEFAKHLKAHNIPVSMEFFESIKPLKGESDSYEVISVPEGIKIAEWVRDNEKNKATMKYYYILLAIDSSVRADALSKLTPKNFVELEDTVLIKGVDKGKKNFSKRISKELYQEMKDNLKEWTALHQPIFSISPKNRTDMMNRALKGLGWENRNIRFHSLKKAGVNHAFETTGDIRVAMKVASHSSVSTTQTYLAEDGEDFLGAISNGNLKKIKALDYMDFSKEELIAAVQSMSENFQYQLKSQLIK